MVVGPCQYVCVFRPPIGFCLITQTRSPITKFGATFDARVVPMLGHDMFAIEVFRYQLVDFLNLVVIVLRFDTFLFGGVGDTGERAFPAHQNFVWGQAAFTYLIMQVQQSPR
jgi:hypothetical protein